MFCQISLTLSCSPLAAGFFSGKYASGVPAGSRFSDFAYLRKTYLRPEYTCVSEKCTSVCTFWTNSSLCS